MLAFGAKSDQGNSDQELRRLVDAIVADEESVFAQLIDGSAGLAKAEFSGGATRQGKDLDQYFLNEIGHWIYSGDTALHFAAASYRCTLADRLLKAGASVRAKNRRGSEPLHRAAVGSPGSERWDPAAQTATIRSLISAGADPNAANMDGATPLHLAVRTRCAAAVKALLDHGANPEIQNKSGSTPRQLARPTTGRSGAGSPEAKAQQLEILAMLGEATGRR